jgi:hypothetical protein
MVSTINSAVMLSTMGSVVVDTEQDRESVEMARMQGLGIDIGRGSMKDIAAGEDDGRSRGKGSRRGHDQEDPMPTYHAVELEMGFRTARPSIDTTPGVSGIRVDVEKTTSTM